MPIPSKKWKAISQKPFYPNTKTTYEILVSAEPTEHPETKGLNIIQTKQGRLLAWDTLLVEIAQLLEKHDFTKDVQVRFSRDDKRRFHVHELVERLPDK